jgi:hypothetical protein
MTNEKIRLNIVACALGLFAAGCSTGTPNVDASYGEAVQSVVDAQLYDPAAAANPSTDAIEGTDGQRMEAVMKAHRGQMGTAESVSNPIVINVD